MPSLVDVVVSMVLSSLMSSTKVSEAGADDELSHITQEKWYILKVNFFGRRIHPWLHLVVATV